jgi:uncharacterized protein YcfJ
VNFCRDDCVGMKRNVILMREGLIPSIIAFVMLAGCATDPGETTAIGAATGGVLGAGLGAIVGNQTGDPGTGLALGTLVGSATGAYIGNSIQAQEEESLRSDELIERQKDSIRARRREIDSLRSLESDDSSRRSHDLSREGRERPTYPKSLGRSTFQEATVVPQSQESRDNYQYDDRYELADSPRREVPRRENPERVVDENYDKKLDALPRPSLLEGGSTDAGLSKRVSPAPRASDIFAPTNSVPLESASSPSEINHGRDTMTSIEEGTSTNENDNNSLPTKENSSRQGTKRTTDWTSALQQRKVAGIRDGSIKSTNESKQAVGSFQKKKGELVKKESVKKASSSKVSKARPLIALPPEEDTSSTTTDALDDTVASSPAAIEDSNVDDSGAPSQCAKAEEEMMKASSTSETPDKLFHYRRALRLCPSNPSYHVKLGDLYLSLKRKSDAEFEFKEALKIDPKFEEAKKKLGAP